MTVICNYINDDERQAWLTSARMGGSVSSVCGPRDEDRGAAMALRVLRRDLARGKAGVLAKGL